MTKDDLIVAFFPCIHFCGVSQTMFGINEKNYKNMTNKQKFDYIINKSNLRTEFFNRLNRFVCVVLEKGLRMVFENPWMGQQFLRVFLKQPDIIDENRMLRGDFMVKPTAYWFWNCEPTRGFSYQCDKEQKHPMSMKKNPVAGQCSEERSMISPDYARNWIHDFILGKSQDFGQLSLF